LIIYLAVLAANALFTLTGFSFIAMRKAEFRFLQSMIAGLRVLLLFPLIFLGAMGIFGAFGLSFVLSLAVSLFFLARLGVKFTLRIDRGFINDALHFSAGNYIANLLMLSPNQLLPIMVLNILGAIHAAHYYIAFAIVNLLFMIPQAVSTSLFVEGSHGEALRKSTIKSLLAIAPLLTPSVVFLYVFGEDFLALIGKDYAASGFELLRIMVLASFFVAICQIYFSIKRVQKDIKGLISLSSLIFVLLIGLSYIFMLRFGIVGIGYAWIVSYGIAVLAVGFVVKREKWI
jgi:O-antigen/teichoic acid export membrane protein